MSEKHQLLRWNGMLTRRLRTGLEIVAASLVTAFLLKWFVLGAIVVPSHSMESTILPGDYVLVNKLIYGARSTIPMPFSQAAFSGFRMPGLSAIRRGDVVVFEFPELEEAFSLERSSTFVKRCIALGGDQVLIEHGVVFVNGGRAFDSDNGASEKFSLGKQMENYGPVAVPRRGDNIRLTPQNWSRWEAFVRGEGHSLTYSPSMGTRIDGSLASTYAVEKNYLFVLGDNRDESYDSRYWGFLPEEDVVGKAMMVYWSRDLAFSVSNLPEIISGIRWNRIGIFIH